MQDEEQATTQSPETTRQPVVVNLYDINKCNTISFTQTQWAIWHTGVVVFGSEFFYGRNLYQSDPGKTSYGTPVSIIDMGYTEVTREAFAEYLAGLETRYTPDNYHLLYNNCNHFTNEAVQFLTGKELPSFITSLPQQAVDSQLGRILPVPVIALIDGMLTKTKHT